MKRKPWSVLIAEDNAVSRHLAVAILEQHGAVVVTAMDGRQAVDAWAPGRFDVILMDLLMPELDGLEATRMIRARESGLTHVPIIALTARSLPGDRKMCETVGMNGFITKPLQGNELIETIEHILEPPTVPAPRLIDIDAISAALSFDDLERAALLRCFAAPSVNVH